MYTVYEKNKYFCQNKTANWYIFIVEILEHTENFKKIIKNVYNLNPDISCYHFSVFSFIFFFLWIWMWTIWMSLNIFQSKWVSRLELAKTDSSLETLIFWPLDAKSWLIGKVPDAGKDCRQDERGTTDDEMVGWHHRLKGHEPEQTLGDGEGRGNLACCSPWGHKVRHDLATEQEASNH